MRLTAVEMVKQSRLWDFDCFFKMSINSYLINLSAFRHPCCSPTSGNDVVVIEQQILKSLIKKAGEMKT